MYSQGKDFGEVTGLPQRKSYKTFLQFSVFWYYFAIIIARKFKNTEEGVRNNPVLRLFRHKQKKQRVSLSVP